MEKITFSNIVWPWTLTYNLERMHTKIELLIIFMIEAKLTESSGLCKL